MLYSAQPSGTQRLSHSAVELKSLAAQACVPQRAIESVAFMSFIYLFFLSVASHTLMASEAGVHWAC